MHLSVTLKNVSGYCVGLPKLTMQFDLKHDSSDSARVLYLTAEVRTTACAQVYDPAKSAVFLGYAILESNGWQMAPGQQQTFTLGLALTPYHLQKIEETRNGRDLYLIVKFTSAVVELDKTDPSKLKGFHSPDASTPGYSSSYCPFKVAQSDWMKILKDLGYGDYFLIEVPLRRIRSRKQMDKALEHLSKAWEHYAEDNNRETLASCFSAFEYLTKQAKSKSTDQNAFEKLLGSVENRDMKDKLKLLMHYICGFLQVGRHVQGHELANVERKDSELGLILSQAALAYLAKSMSRDWKDDKSANPEKLSGGWQG